MSRYVRSEGCPNCGSSDARAIYQDNSSYCFSCSTFTGAGLKDRLKPRKSNEKAVKVIDTSDWQYSIPSVALDWLDKYGITGTELSFYGFRWNPNLKSKLWDGPAGALAMPLFDNGRVVCVSYRLFDQDKPKSITLGYRPYITIGNIESDSVIVVEDYISALKVSRIAPCIPLLGSNMPDDAILRLSKAYRSVYFWLDEDKLVPAMKMATKAGLLGMTTGTIYTELDPKCHSTEELKRILCRKCGV